MRKTRWILFQIKEGGKRVYLTPEGDVEDISTWSRWIHEAHLFEFRKEFAHLEKFKGVQVEKLDISKSVAYDSKLR